METYQPVGFGKAFIEQFRLLWVTRRPLMLFIGMIGVLVLAGEPWTESYLARLPRTWPIWILITGPLWGFAVWHNEGPSHRLYLWSQPVGRTAHSLARLAAGGAWLVLLYTLLIAVGLLFAMFDGNASQLGAIGTVPWVSFFTGPLVGYLMISALTVASDYPVRWFLAILFGVPVIVSLLVEGFGLDDEIEWLFTPLIDREWGLAVSMFAPFIVAVERLEDIVTSTGQGGAGIAEILDLSTWWVAMPLWMLFWTGIVALIARRHPDVFPRWRRGGGG